MTGAVHRPVRYPAWKAVAARLLEAVVRPFVVTAPPPRGLDVICRILIVEPFRLGDAALLRSMFAPLHERFPGAEIHLLLHPCAADLYRDNPAVAAIHEFALPWTSALGPRHGWIATWRFLRSLRAFRFDLGIDPRGDVRSQAALVLTGCAERAGYTNYLACNIRICGKLLTRNAGDVLLGHREDIHGSILELLGCRKPGLPVRIPRSDTDGRLHILISIGAGWSFRLWPEARWMEVVRWLTAQPGINVRLVGTPAERSGLDRICAHANGGAEVVVTDLPTLLRELSAADLVICPDSAVMHLASEWFGLPVLALFGPGVVPLYRPRSVGSRVIDAQADYPCAPCTQQRCVRLGDPCMTAIGVEEVIRTLETMMAGERTWTSPLVKATN